MVFRMNALDNLLGSVGDLHCFSNTCTFRMLVLIEPRYGPLASLRYNILLTLKAMNQPILIIVNI